jgi:hypothetical protein
VEPAVARACRGLSQDTLVIGLAGLQPRGEKASPRVRGGRAGVRSPQAGAPAAGERSYSSVAVVHAWGGPAPGRGGPAGDVPGVGG